MAAPFRIRRAPAGAAAASGPPAPPADPIRAWVDRLIRLIPSEIVAVYLAGRGYAAAWPGRWSLVCLALLFIVRIWGTREPPRGPQWIAVGVAAVSYVIWVLAMGGEFPGVHVSANVAALSVLVWVTLVPVIYRGD